MTPPIPSLRGVPMEALDTRVQELGSSPLRPTGESFRTNCFGHGGTKRGTLSFRPTPDGRSWSVTCFAGCQSSAIVEALLEAGPLPTTDGPVADFTPKRGNGERPHWFSKQEVAKVVAYTRELREHHPDVLAKLEAERRITRETVEAEFIGFKADERRVTMPFMSPHAGDNQGVYGLDRWRPGWERSDDEIKVLPAPDGRQRWLGFPRPELLRHGWAILTEGMMDALAVVSHGLPAISAPSADFREEWTGDLVRLGVARLIVPADNDEAGQRFVAAVRAAVEQANIKVFPLDLGMTEEGADVTDFLRQFQTFEAGAAELRRRCRNAELSALCVGVDVRPLSSFELSSVEWFWRRFIPRGELTVIAADGGLGKSTFVGYLCGQLGRGEVRGALGTGNVLVLLGEDDPARVLRSRYAAAGADMDRVYVVSADDYPLMLPDDLGVIAQLIEATRPDVLIIDPLAASLAETIDAHRDGGRGGMRAVLMPLARLAQTTGVTILVVVHTRKGGGPSSDAMAGTKGLRNAARNVLHLVAHPEATAEGVDDGRRILGHDKCNYGPLQPSLEVRVEAVEVVDERGRVVLDKEGNPVTTSRMQIGGSSAIDYRTALDAASKPSSGAREEKSALDDAIEFLRSELADGPRRTPDLEADARDAGIAPRTLRRARQQLGVRASKGAEGWTVCLPDVGTGSLGPVEPLARNRSGDRESQEGQASQPGQEGHRAKPPHELAQFIRQRPIAQPIANGAGATDLARANGHD